MIKHTTVFMKNYFFNFVYVQDEKKSSEGFQDICFSIYL